MKALDKFIGLLATRKAMVAMATILAVAAAERWLGAGGLICFAILLSGVAMILAIAIEDHGAKSARRPAAIIQVTPCGHVKAELIENPTHEDPHRN